MSLKLENNRLTFRYFGKAAPQDETWQAFDNNGLYYRSDMTQYPYLVTATHQIKLDEKTVDRLMRPFQFVVFDEALHSKSFPHEFMFCETISEINDNTPAFEVRTRNDSGQWQDWQIILGSEFDVYKVNSKLKDLALKMPIESELSDLKDNFQIRYSGEVYLGHFLVQVMTIDQHLIRVNMQSRQVEFFADSGSLDWPFDERVAEWQAFEAKYFQYDNNGTRL